jgi:hypothetical protein
MESAAAKQAMLFCPDQAVGITDRFLYFYSSSSQPVSKAAFPYPAPAQTSGCATLKKYSGKNAGNQ